MKPVPNYLSLCNIICFSLNHTAAIRALIFSSVVREVLIELYGRVVVIMEDDRLALHFIDMFLKHVVNFPLTYKTSLNC